MRVLTPGGVAMIRKEDTWQRVEKPWPDTIDQWTHHLHGPDNNPVAQDTEIGPPRRLQWQSPSLWSRSHEHISSFAAMVSAAGRTFYIFDDSVPGVTVGVPAKWTLYARDAFSGVLLWKKPLEHWDSPITNSKTLRSTSAVVQRRRFPFHDPRPSWPAGRAGRSDRCAGPNDRRDGWDRRNHLRRRHALPASALGDL